MKIDFGRVRSDDLALVHARDHVLSAEAPAEEYIEYKSYDRQEYEGYDP